jgi:hypothetical protein
MSNIQIYNERSVNLSPMSFVNDIQNQLKIRDLDTDSVDFENEIAVFFTKTVNLLGIKEAILDVNKGDILEMLITHYKGLSVNELYYAFKLERYGKLSPKTQHYQLINAEYVSSVLDKYVNWKVSQRKNNITTVKIQASMSEDQKTKIENDIVVRFIETYLSERIVEDEYFYVYDILDNRGLMNKDREYKQKVKEDAIYLLNQKYSGKKATSMDELKSIKSKLKLFKEGQGGEIKAKCKILALEEFFRNLCRDEKKLKEFKLKF